MSASTHSAVSPPRPFQYSDDDRRVAEIAERKSPYLLFIPVTKLLDGSRRLRRRSHVGATC